MSAVVFKLYWQRNYNRTSLFETSDRALAWETACACERAVAAAGGNGAVEMLIVEDNCILNDEPDWRHPDFKREKARIPMK